MTSLTLIPYHQGKDVSDRDLKYRRAEGATLPLAWDHQNADRVPTPDENVLNGNRGVRTRHRATESHGQIPQGSTSLCGYPPTIPARTIDIVSASRHANQ